MKTPRFLAAGDGVTVDCPIWKVGGDTDVVKRELKKIISVLESFRTSLFCTAHDFTSRIQASILIMCSLHGHGVRFIYFLHG